MASTHLHEFGTVINRSTVESNSGFVGMTRSLKGNGDNTSGLTLAVIGNLALTNRTNLVLKVVLKKEKKKKRCW
jgi:hypothetical protein